MSEQRLRGFVREQLEAPPLPLALQRQIITQAMQPPRRQGWQRLFPPVALRDYVLGMATAALFVLAAYTILPELASDGDLQRFVHEASLAYSTYTNHRMPLEVVSTDDSAVKQWLNTRMGNSVNLPGIADKATQLVGGRLCRLVDKKSAAVMYQRNGVPLLLFAFHGDRLSFPHKANGYSTGDPFHIRQVSGRPVAMWQHNGVVYSMVGDLNRDDLVRVVETMTYR
ncbi:MAG: hypothetical protein AB7N91_15970 [Candidatus Tectimicrobiota bacterium]